MSEFSIAQVNAPVKWFGNTNWFRTFWKGKLDRMVSRLAEEGVENTPYKDKTW